MVNQSLHASRSSYLVERCFGLRRDAITAMLLLLVLAE